MKNIILTSYAKIRWNNRNKGHYVRLGYNYTGIGNKFIVSVDDIPVHSRLKVDVLCPLCLEERSKTVRSINKTGSTYCRSCSHINNLTGSIFGNLTVINLSYTKNKRAYWSCLCTCGNITTVRSDSLITGNTKSCGCLSITILKNNTGSKHHNFVNIIGEKFGRLTPIKYIGDSKWKCVCDCGNKTEVATSRLNNGDTRSCGCLLTDLLSSWVGEKHPNWNPDLTDKDREDRRIDREYKLWASKVKERDKYVCQSCLNMGGDLVSHHINDFSTFPELKYDIANGLTLCKTCHYDFHINFMGGWEKPCTIKNLLLWNNNIKDQRL